MAVTQKGFFFLGLSTDAKPTTGISVNDRFLETDTRQEYVWSGAAWVPSSVDFFGKFREFVSWGSVDGFTVGGDAGYSVTPFGATVQLRTNNVADNDAYLKSGIWPLILSAGKAISYEWVLNYLSSIADQNIWLRLTPAATDPPVETDQHFGFKIIGADIYASNADGANQTINDTGVDAIADYQRVRLGLVYTPGAGIKFYVNGALTNTHNTNLPAGVSYILSMHIRTLAAANKTVLIGRGLLEVEHP